MQTYFSVWRIDTQQHTQKQHTQKAKGVSYAFISMLELESCLLYETYRLR